MRLFRQTATFLILLSVPGWSGMVYLPSLPQDGISDTFDISSDSTVAGVSNIGLWAPTAERRK
ncbi:MAG: hypothetical protein ABSG41_05795 [Bryobacteraceae bacterium]|jgi:hypothetical protein